MSEERDKQILTAFIDLEKAVREFEMRTRIPLRGYTTKQPYAKAIRQRMTFINEKLKEEFWEIQPTLEPDPKEPL